MNKYAWNAVEYSNNSAAQFSWAQELLKKLHLHGGESVLDIGSGDGKVTALIAEQVPRGFVLGIDSSYEMVKLAQTKFPNSLVRNLHFEQHDIRSFSMKEKFDVAFSNATLHWIIDQQPVLTNIHRALRPNGRMLVQMGGSGNAALVVEALDNVCAMSRWNLFFKDFLFPYGFYLPEQYRTWLHEAGFIDIRVELIPKRMVFRDETGFKGWFRSTWLPYLERIPAEQKEEFIEDVTNEYIKLSPPTDNGIEVGMVRLEVEALKR
ncbi:MAG TPA: methyltransferase domain-containing protein [Bacteroidota bacterium]|jgi:trans-aconitate methyltransferase|nr:methyltransferase domain-containing protein [Bacteroidota bacterium]